MKIAKNEHSNGYHYYFKVTISFQFLTTIRYGKQGIWWACANLRRGSGAGEGGAGGLDPIGKSRYMGRSRSKPPPAPDEISWFRAWGGGGNLFHWNALEQIA